MPVKLRPMFGETRPASMRDILIPKDLNVVVLAPHPDDFDAVGITLRHFRENGNSIEVGVVTTGSGVEETYCPGATLREKTILRRKEQERSLRFFGLPESSAEFLDLESDERDQPVDSPTNLDWLREFLLARQPDIVLLPHGNDTNSGHRCIYALFRRALNEKSL